MATSMSNDAESEIEELESLHSMKSTDRAQGYPPSVSMSPEGVSENPTKRWYSVFFGLRWYSVFSWLITSILERPDSALVAQQGASETPIKRCDSASVQLQIDAFEKDYQGNMQRKMWRIPPALSSFRERYGAPVAMPLGPYTGTKSGLLSGMPPDLDTVNTVKDVATHHFRLGTHYGSIADMFKAFCSTVGDVRGLCQHTEDFLLAYGNEATDGDTLLKFNMLRDGCFLMEYMKAWIIGGYRNSMPKLLKCYLDSNEANINRDIMLLENQVPWVVIKTLSGMDKIRGQRKMERVVKKFVAKMARTLHVQVRRGTDDGIPDLEGSEPPVPHLLGLLQSYKAGYESHRLPPPSRPKSKTITAIELAEIGIKLKASKTTRLIDMGFKETLLGAEIFLAPLLLDEIRLCWLVNMVAFELCVATLPTYAVACGIDALASSPARRIANNGQKDAVSIVSDPEDAGRIFSGSGVGIRFPIFDDSIVSDTEDALSTDNNGQKDAVSFAGPFNALSNDNNGQKHAVSTYLVVLAMLMNREEDVHALRSKGIVQGQLTDKEIFDFFKNLAKNISGEGRVYTQLMQGLEEYRTKRWVWIKLYKFIYNNYRTIAALLSIAGVLAGIFKTLLSLKQH